MFPTHKRARSEDEESLQAVYENKKLRTLPFRTSPTTKHSTLFSTRKHAPKPPALTPAESSEDESDVDFKSPRYPSKATIPSFLHTQDEDMDMEMDDAQHFSSPMWSPKTPATASMIVSASLASPAYPSMLIAGPSPVHHTARLPTPIYGHFSSLHNPLQQNSASPTATRPSVAGVARSSMAEQHDAFLRRRRLPSPISEDENMESPTTVTKSMMKHLDVSGAPASATFPSSATFPEHEMMTPETPEFGSRKDSSASGGSYGSRRRSDAISGGGEGSKVVFSMGYRADCDKCREKVPGHYSHILRV